MKKKMKNQLFFLILFTSAFLISCAQNISPNNYNVQNVGDVSKVVRGKIVSARPVQVSGNSTGVGGLAGAFAGGAAGSAIGGGARANFIGAVGGALAGGLLGNAVEKRVSKQTGIEYIVKTSKGHMLSIAQGSQSPLAVGQHVMVILGSPARIIADTE